MFKILSSNISHTLTKNLCSNNCLKLNKSYQLVNAVAKYSSGNESAKSESPQETPNLSEDQVREKILTNAMKHVPNLGFSTDALSQGAIDAGLSPAAKGMFKQGEFDLIDYFYKSSNQKLADYLENLVNEGKIKSKNELIKSALVYRLGLIQPYINQWPQAMAVASFNPAYALTSIENLLRLCDEIWHQMGDTSTDINWYTKRLTLAAIYKSTELFMIQDKSESFKETFEFLDNRFNDLAYFGKVNSQLTNFKDAFIGSFTVMKNVISNIKN